MEVIPPKQDLLEYCRTHNTFPANVMKEKEQAIKEAKARYNKALKDDYDPYEIQRLSDHAENLMYDYDYYEEQYAQFFHAQKKLKESASNDPAVQKEAYNRMHHASKLERPEKIDYKQSSVALAPSADSGGNKLYNDHIKGQKEFQQQQMQEHIQQQLALRDQVRMEKRQIKQHNEHVQQIRDHNRQVMNEQHRQQKAQKREQKELQKKARKEEEQLLQDADLQEKLLAQQDVQEAKMREQAGELKKQWHNERQNNAELRRMRQSVIQQKQPISQDEWLQMQQAHITQGRVSSGLHEMKAKNKKMQKELQEQREQIVSQYQTQNLSKTQLAKRRELVQKQQQQCQELQNMDNNIDRHWMHQEQKLSLSTRNQPPPQYDENQPSQAEIEQEIQRQHEKAMEERLEQQKMQEMANMAPQRRQHYNDGTQQPNMAPNNQPPPEYNRNQPPLTSFQQEMQRLHEKEMEQRLEEQKIQEMARIAPQGRQHFNEQVTPNSQYQVSPQNEQYESYQSEKQQKKQKKREKKMERKLEEQKIQEMARIIPQARQQSNEEMVFNSNKQLPAQYTQNQPQMSANQQRFFEKVREKQLEEQKVEEMAQICQQMRQSVNEAQPHHQQEQPQQWWQQPKEPKKNKNKKKKGKKAKGQQQFPEKELPQLKLPHHLELEQQQMQKAAMQQNQPMSHEATAYGPPVSYQKQLRQEQAMAYEEQMQHQQAMAYEEQMQHQQAMAYEEQMQHQQAMAYEEQMQRQQAMAYEEQMQHQQAMAYEEQMQHQQAMAYEEQMQRQQAMAYEEQMQHEQAMAYEEQMQHQQAMTSEEMEHYSHIPYKEEPFDHPMPYHQMMQQQPMSDREDRPIMKAMTNEEELQQEFEYAEQMRYEHELLEQKAYEEWLQKEEELIAEQEGKELEEKLTKVNAVLNDVPEEKVYKNMEEEMAAVEADNKRLTEAHKLLFEGSDNDSNVSSNSDSNDGSPPQHIVKTKEVLDMPEDKMSENLEEERAAVEAESKRLTEARRRLFEDSDDDCKFSVNSDSDDGPPPEPIVEKAKFEACISKVDALKAKFQARFSETEILKAKIMEAPKVDPDLLSSDESVAYEASDNVSEPHGMTRQAENMDADFNESASSISELAEDVPDLPEDENEALAPAKESSMKTEIDSRPMANFEITSEPCPQRRRTDNMATDFADSESSISEEAGIPPEEGRTLKAKFEDFMKDSEIRQQARIVDNMDSDFEDSESSISEDITSEEGAAIKAEIEDLPRPMVDFKLAAEPQQMRRRPDNMDADFYGSEKSMSEVEDITPEEGTAIKVEIEDSPRPMVDFKLAAEPQQMRRRPDNMDADFDGSEKSMSEVEDITPEEGTGSKAEIEDSPRPMVDFKLAAEPQQMRRRPDNMDADFDGSEKSMSEVEDITPEEGTGSKAEIEDSPRPMVDFKLAAEPQQMRRRPDNMDADFYGSEKSMSEVKDITPEEGTGSKAEIEDSPRPMVDFKQAAEPQQMRTSPGSVYADFEESNKLIRNNEDIAPEEKRVIKVESDIDRSPRPLADLKLAAEPLKMISHADNMDADTKISESCMAEEDIKVTLEMPENAKVKVTKFEDPKAIIQSHPMIRLLDGKDSDTDESLFADDSDSDTGLHVEPRKTVKSEKDSPLKAKNSEEEFFRNFISEEKILEKTANSANEAKLMEAAKADNIDQCAITKQSSEVDLEVEEGNYAEIQEAIISPNAEQENKSAIEEIKEQLKQVQQTTMAMPKDEKYTFTTEPNKVESQGELFPKEDSEGMANSLKFENEMSVQETTVELAEKASFDTTKIDKSAIISNSSDVEVKAYTMGEIFNDSSIAEDSDTEEPQLEYQNVMKAESKTTFHEEESKNLFEACQVELEPETLQDNLIDVKGELSHPAPKLLPEPQKEDEMKIKVEEFIAKSVTEKETYISGEDSTKAEAESTMKSKCDEPSNITPQSECDIFSQDFEKVEEAKTLISQDEEPSILANSGVDLPKEDLEKSEEAKVLEFKVEEPFILADAEAHILQQNLDIANVTEVDLPGVGSNKSEEKPMKLTDEVPSTTANSEVDIFPQKLDIAKVDDVDLEEKDLILTYEELSIAADSEGDIFPQKLNIAMDNIIDIPEEDLKNDRAKLKKLTDEEPSVAGDSEHDVFPQNLNMATVQKVDLSKENFKKSDEEKLMKVTDEDLSIAADSDIDIFPQKANIVTVDDEVELLKQDMKKLQDACKARKFKSVAKPYEEESEENAIDINFCRALLHQEEVEVCPKAQRGHFMIPTIQEDSEVDGKEICVNEEGSLIDEDTDSLSEYSIGGIEAAVVVHFETLPEDIPKDLFQSISKSENTTVPGPKDAMRDDFDASSVDNDSDCLHDNSHKSESLVGKKGDIGTSEHVTIEVEKHASPKDVQSMCKEDLTAKDQQEEREEDSNISQSEDDSESTPGIGAYYSKEELDAFIREEIAKLAKAKRADAELAMSKMREFNASLREEVFRYKQLQPNQEGMEPRGKKMWLWYLPFPPEEPRELRLHRETHPNIKVPQTEATDPFSPTDYFLETNPTVVEPETIKQTMKVPAEATPACHSSAPVDTPDFPKIAVNAEEKTMEEAPKPKPTLLPRKEGLPATPAVPEAVETEETQEKSTENEVAFVSQKDAVPKAVPKAFEPEKRACAEALYQSETEDSLKDHLSVKKTPSLVSPKEAPVKAVEVANPENMGCTEKVLSIGSSSELNQSEKTLCWIQKRSLISPNEAPPNELVVYEVAHPEKKVCNEVVFSLESASELDQFEKRATKGDLCIPTEPGSILPAEAPPKAADASKIVEPEKNITKEDPMRSPIKFALVSPKDNRPMVDVSGDVEPEVGVEDVPVHVPTDPALVLAKEPLMNNAVAPEVLEAERKAPKKDILQSLPSMTKFKPLPKLNFCAGKVESEPPTQNAAIKAPLKKQAEAFVCVSELTEEDLKQEDRIKTLLENTPTTRNTTNKAALKMQADAVARISKLMGEEPKKPKEDRIKTLLENTKTTTDTTDKAALKMQADAVARISKLMGEEPKKPKEDRIKTLLENTPTTRDTANKAALKMQADAVARISKLMGEEPKKPKEDRVKTLLENTPTTRDTANKAALKMQADAVARISKLMEEKPKEREEDDHTKHIRETREKAELKREADARKMQADAVARISKLMEEEAKEPEVDRVKTLLENTPTIRNTTNKAALKMQANAVARISKLMANEPKDPAELMPDNPKVDRVKALLENTPTTKNRAALKPLSKRLPKPAFTGSMIEPMRTELPQEDRARSLLESTPRVPSLGPLKRNVLPGLGSELPQENRARSLLESTPRVPSLAPLKRNALPGLGSEIRRPGVPTDHQAMAPLRVSSAKSSQPKLPKAPATAMSQPSSPALGQTMSRLGPLAPI